ncbi:MAG: molybdopterin synthase sulfur carrier subunit [Acidobacteria bacterium]|nr:molybdopterin synthase sulfur carrier subunit [Acidobacteriota bacterium]
MPRVFLPTMLRELTGGAAELEAAGATVRELLDELEARHPGLRARLCDGDRLRSNLAVAVNGEVEPLGLLARVQPDAEVHFVPAIAGGSGARRSAFVCPAGSRVIQ